jgi:hypothetical protein
VLSRKGFAAAHLYVAADDGQLSHDPQQQHGFLAVLLSTLWCHSGVTEVSQWCYSGIAVVLQDHLS